MPQHIAERLCLSVAVGQPSTRLRLGELRHSLKKRMGGQHGKPEAYRYVLRQSRTKIRSSNGFCGEGQVSGLRLPLNGPRFPVEGPQSISEGSPSVVEGSQSPADGSQSVVEA